MSSRGKWYALLALRWIIGIGAMLIASSFIYSRSWALWLKITSEFVVAILILSALLLGPVS